VSASAVVAINVKNAGRETPQRDVGVADDVQVLAIFSDPTTYERAKLLKVPNPIRGGRPRLYPDFLVVAYDQMADLYDGVRNAATQLSGITLWPLIRETVAARFPDEPEMHLPENPPCSTWFYRRSKALAASNARQQRHLMESGSQLASDLGLLDEKGPGSRNHPDRDRMIYGDGKTMATMLPNGKPGKMRTALYGDRETGELIEVETQVRFDPDAKVHTDGTKEQVHGIKFWSNMIRGRQPHMRVMLTEDHVPEEKGENNSEGAVMLASLLALDPYVPAALGYITDGVMHGLHLDQLQRATGKVIISPVAAKKTDKDGRRLEEKEGFLDVEIFDYENGDKEVVELWYRRGGVCARQWSADGSSVLVPLRRTASPRRKNADGTFRTYVEYEVPCPRGVLPSQTTRHRTYTNDEDRAAKFNRSENVRQIAWDDPDYSVYGRRSDAESSNRDVDDHSYLGRARSIGIERQLMNRLSRDYRVNALSRYLYLHAKAATAAA
jgi:hypothetical protein